MRFRGIQRGWGRRRSPTHSWIEVSDLLLLPSDHLGVYPEARLNLQQGEPYLSSLELGWLQIWTDISESCRSWWVPEEPVGSTGGTGSRWVVQVVGTGGWGGGVGEAGVHGTHSLLLSLSQAHSLPPPPLPPPLPRTLQRPPALWRWVSRTSSAGKAEVYFCSPTIIEHLLCIRYHATS